ncbi:hypothetical protein KFL_000450170 [Klebsormidium nitens]|uniref:Uncharacterized protein n=1 Tax=Klebsormidium nitens TaxID=105231 RepID=A0A1Y1HST5_KLENI|nr:hypothetical protein KFL_000450170 [Klebsormidium nitens]|eukprot:GAQ80061.1 hypothetical protein KFL_000450170 [Klebsormidium nitens]
MASAARLLPGVSFCPSALLENKFSNSSTVVAASAPAQPACHQSRKPWSARIKSGSTVTCSSCKAALAKESRSTGVAGKSNADVQRRQVLLAGLAAAGLSLATVTPAQAGILSGSQGLEQAEAPGLPEIGLFKQIKEGNKKRQDDLDSSFEQSDLLKELRKKSADNKEKNKKEILDKYCVRGSEWGVGDCAVKGLPESVESAQSTRKLLSDAIDKLRGNQ